MNINKYVNVFNVKLKIDELAFLYALCKYIYSFFYFYK